MESWQGLGANPGKPPNSWSKDNVIVSYSEFWLIGSPKTLGFKNNIIKCCSHGILQTFADFRAKSVRSVGKLNVKAACKYRQGPGQTPKCTFDSKLMSINDNEKKTLMLVRETKDILEFGYKTLRRGSYSGLQDSKRPMELAEDLLFMRQMKEKKH